MQSTHSETSSAAIPESAKMDANQVDSDTLKNGIEQNETQIDREETHLTESKIFLNGTAHKEHAECDNHELSNNVIHENNVNSDPVVINSVNDINIDKKTDTASELNKDEKVFPLKPEENAVLNEEPKSSVGEIAPLKTEVNQEADESLKNLPKTFKEEDVKEPEELMDILGNGLLLKKVLKAGNGHMTRPAHGQRVALKTEGKLENGTIIDKNDRIEFVLGDGDVISAWDIAVALMEENEIAELKCDAKYAYGSLGRSPEIPGNATITYTLALIGKEDGPNYNFMSIDERIYHGSLKKERGNYLFSRSDYRGAINSYLKAISIIDNENVSFEEPPKKLQQLLEDKIKCYNNLAAAQLKADYYDAAIKSCEGVLKHHPENVKALFRMGKAYAAKGETKEAIIQMKKALKLEPETKIIHQELSKLTKKLTKETQSERNMYKKMFRTTKTPVKPSVEHSRWKWPVIAGSLAVVLLSVGVAYFRYRQH